MEELIKSKITNNDYMINILDFAIDVPKNIRNCNIKDETLLMDSLERETSNKTSDKFVEKIEKQYLMADVEEKERQQEVVTLNKKMNILKHELKNCKNIKNHRAREINKKISDKRKNINNEINKIKDRLEEISIEKQVPNIKKEGEFNNSELMNFGIDTTSDPTKYY